MNKKPLISVITVCFNAEKDIEFTIKSILDQDYADFEYLIKDGGSADSTLEIVRKYAGCFEDRNISYRIISESDDGIYDAMNQAAKHAEGEWVIYINAGDALFDEKVLSRLSSELTDECDVLYGNTALLDNNKYKLLSGGDLTMFKKTNPICHQAVLTRTDVVRQYTFNTKYGIAADFDLFLGLYVSGRQRFKRTDTVFSIFRFGGVSNKKILQREKEFNESRKQQGIKRVALPHLQIVWTSLIYLVRRIAIIILGEKFYSARRGWYTDKYELVKTHV